MFIAVDFDGTIVKHLYPKIGEDIGAFGWLKKWQEAGAKLILLTMRGDQELRDAINHCRNKGIEFWAINHNPTQRRWTTSPKIYAHMYVDDLSFGMPLVTSDVNGERSWVDWSIVGPKVLERLTGESVKSVTEK